MFFLCFSALKLVRDIIPKSTFVFKKLKSKTIYVVVMSNAHTSALATAVLSSPDIWGST